MNLISAIDSEIAVIIGSISGLLAAAGAIWIKTRSANFKAANDDVNNTIKITKTMNGIIDILEKELEGLSGRMERCRNAIKDRDESILELRKSLHDAEAEIYRLKGGNNEQA